MGTISSGYITAKETSTTDRTYEAFCQKFSLVGIVPIHALPGDVIYHMLISRPTMEQLSKQTSILDARSLNGNVVCMDLEKKYYATLKTYQELLVVITMTILYALVAEFQFAMDVGGCH